MDTQIIIDPVTLIIGLTDEEREQLRQYIKMIKMTTICIPNSFNTIKY